MLQPSLPLPLFLPVSGPSQPAQKKRTTLAACEVGQRQLGPRRFVCQGHCEPPFHALVEPTVNISVRAWRLGGPLPGNFPRRRLLRRRRHPSFPSIAGNEKRGVPVAPASQNLLLEPVWLALPHFSFICTLDLPSALVPARRLNQPFWCPNLPHQPRNLAATGAPFWLGPTPTNPPAALTPVPVFAPSRTPPAYSKVLGSQRSRSNYRPLVSAPRLHPAPWTQRKL